MNIDFIVFDADGIILRTGNVSEKDVEHQAKPGESVMIGRAGAFQKIVNGRVVDDKDALDAHAAEQAAAEQTRAVTKARLEAIRDGGTTVDDAVKILAKIVLGEK
jgi:hypothetical protein